MGFIKYARLSSFCRVTASLLILLCLLFAGTSSAQKIVAGIKHISPDLFGIFFEDISYAADGGLYAELVQNRSFEYNPNDRKDWQPFTAWEYLTKGYGYGTISVETTTPIHPNNPHYIVLKVEDVGQEGVGLINKGFDGIVIRAGEKYNFSIFTRLVSADPIPLSIQLRSKKGDVYGEATVTANAKEWNKYTAVIEATHNDDSAVLAITAKNKGTLAIDMVSLIPDKTFHGRVNGLRSDLGQVIADLKPKFMRFPGGCLVHGDGLDNMYRWKNTIGPVEQRKEQRNIWNYNQSAGLGYFEYFQFCEDIGAKPLPVLPAAVSCQNSGGTWQIGGTGQRGLPIDEMADYIAEVLDLIEYANGPVTSTWGAKRAAAGHPASFNLEYLGIGNEDKQTPEFRERFKLIYDVVKSKHPEITVIGTVGPFPAGEDYELGWKFANENAVPIVDEHYYEKPEWFLANTSRYDTYDREKSKIYLGEYASRGNTFYNALAEAVYMTSLERNGDVVRMASYAPLLARIGHTSWNPNLIYFTGAEIHLTPNYYVQQMFSNNQGDVYYPDIVSFKKDTGVASSFVKDSKTGDLILKLVNASEATVLAKADLSSFRSLSSNATLTFLNGQNEAKDNVVPVTTVLKPEKQFKYSMAPHSLSVIRIKSKEGK
ncbi:Alpha-L-arabinofuranosidase [Chitinophaga sp. CF118]|uniref:alpha-L-arabinofuranosidase C-terminal domain-containing protein n=1 Tax=Chitinophaga sp. CF118 TaxID=1884367 RepID=UPI0008DFE7FF|nr:alpha-L-arabinofuranosidase C-terminal domain-containing protein [Chitinophaga sp. CF118]SFD62738.1 Alpha-L-arabinofuranosidase [Chitinophaga sp. CF118]